jgi:hypothetical protein
VKIGDTEVPLGSIRQLNAGERDALAAAIKNNADQKAALDARQKDVMDFAQKTQQAYDAVREAATKAANPPPGHGAANDPFQDPWLAPVKKEIDARDKTITELREQVGKLATIVQNAASIWSEDRWDRDYSALDFGKREKKPTREELLDFAVKNNLVDRHKIPSVRSAWEKMSEQDRLSAMKQEEFEKGREAGRMDALAAKMMPPGAPGSGVPPGKQPPTPPGELGDLYEQALKDPELRQMIEQLPTGLI